jgi:hypothetical protein
MHDRSPRPSEGAAFRLARQTAKMHLSDIETILETAPDIAPNIRLGQFRKFS